MLNTREKNSRFARQKKNNIITLVMSEKTPNLIALLPTVPPPASLMVGPLIYDKQ